MPVRTVFLPDAAATGELGRRLGSLLPLGSVLLLAGDLGAGKTTLTQGIARGLGVSEAVGSPTFTLIAEYPGTRGGLVHADLYRLRGAADVESTGLPDYLEGQEGLLVVEWPERWSDWPPEVLHVQLCPHGAGREARLAGAADWDGLLQGFTDAPGA